MASERMRLIQVGVLFVLSIMVLVAGVLWFKEFQFGQKRAVVIAQFPSTSGLIKGDNVEVSGVPSGHVSGIKYENGRSIVTMEIDRETEIRKGSRFVLENVGIMGQKMVAVYPAMDGPIAEPGTIFQGEYQPGIPQLMEGLGGTLDAVNRLAIRLEGMVASFDSTDSNSLQNLLTNSETLTEELAGFVKENRGDLREGLTNFNNAMASLNGALEGREESVARLIDSTEQAAMHLDSSLSRLDSAATRVDSLLARMERGDGSLGKIMGDPALYDEMVTTLRETRALVADVRENPKRYVKLSLF